MIASPTESSWCVLEFMAVQRAFRRQFGRRGPPETSIPRWYEEFLYRGCMCRQVLQNTPIIYEHPVLIHEVQKEEELPKQILRTVKPSSGSSFQ
jgi:hypothetical protein